MTATRRLLRSAVADTAANLLAFLPSLGTGEAFAFGEGVALPTRLKFRQLPAQLLPKSETVMLGDAPAATDNHSLAAVVERWRGRVAKPRLGGCRCGRRGQASGGRDVRRAAIAAAATAAAGSSGAATAATGRARSQPVQTAEAAFGPGRAGSAAPLAGTSASITGRDIRRKIKNSAPTKHGTAAA